MFQYALQLTVQVMGIGFIFISSAGLSVILGNLEPYTVYKVSVRSHSVTEESTFSSEIRCRTDEGRELKVICVIVEP